MTNSNLLMNSSQSVRVPVYVPLCVPAINSFNFEGTESRGFKRNQVLHPLVWFLNLDETYSGRNIQRVHFRLINGSSCIEGGKKTLFAFSQQLY